ncbi:MAG: alpha-galactosidase [Coprobacillus sp.]
MMIEVINNQVFHLSNDKISYIFYILKNNHLGHLYYGKTIHTFTNETFQYFLSHENKAAGTVKYSKEDTKFTLADTMQEYPVFGISDYKDGGISIYDGSTPLYLDLQYCSYKVIKGKEKIKGFPTSYGDEKNTETLIVTLEDKNYNIVVEQRYTIFKDQAVIVRNQVIINNGNKKLTIQKSMSTVLDLPDSNYQFVHLSGGWLKERHIKKHTLSHGTVSVGSLKGASSHQQNPFVALEHVDATLTSGTVYGFNLIYSGNFLAQVEVDEWGSSRAMLGIHPEYFSWTLQNGEEFMTPEAVMCYSNQGMNGLSIEFSEFISEHIIDQKWLTTHRPIVFNSWEAAYYEINYDKLINLAKTAKELGMECFVIDDGWFSKRNDDKSSLGDWYVNKDKFPNGLKKFSNEIHNLGMQLGMWFEPEMISPDSMLYNEHPDWAVHHETNRFCIARNQYVLDFSNPDVIDNIYCQLEKVIKETNVDYIKWDYNRNITEAYSQYLKSEGINQTEFFHRNILGFYQLYERILENFPNILIEGCAGGGGRYDLGVLYYSPLIWVSDDTDAVERLKIQFGTATAYPLSTLSNHVSISPNHQTTRVTSLDMRYQVAAFGSLGYELDLHTLTDCDRECIKKQISDYKKHRDLLIHGTFHKLISPFENNFNQCCWAVTNKDVSKIMIGIYHVLGEPNCKSLEYLQVPFVDVNCNYSIDGEYVLSGDVIANIGIRKPYLFNGINGITAKMKGDFQSWIFYIEKIEM